MIETLKRRASDVAEWIGSGWRNLIDRSGRALTRFVRRDDDAGGVPAMLQRESWGLLASEMLETEKQLIVRVELPGLDGDDFDVQLVGDQLLVRGEKRYERSEDRGHHHLFEAAYGAFERVFTLPVEVDPDSVKATYRRGVLEIRMDKLRPTPSRRIPIRTG